MPSDTIANSSRLCTARDRLCQSLKPPYSSITAGRQRIRRADGRSVCTASTSRRAEQAHEQQPREPSIDRRLSLVALAGAAVLCSRPADAAGSADEATYASDASQAGPGATLGCIRTPDYMANGPLSSSAFPNLEHTCSRCFPACIGNRCMLRLGVIFPRDGRSKGMPSRPNRSALCVFFQLNLPCGVTASSHT